MPATKRLGAPPPGPGVVPVAACAAAGTALATLVVLTRGWGAWLPPALMLAAIAPYLAYIDWTRQLLPNRVLGPAYAVAMAALIVAGAAEGPLFALVRAVTTSVIALIGALVVSVATSGIGGGDVKLIGLITLSLGPNSWTAPGLAILYGFLFAAATTVVHALAARLRQRPRPATIPLGPYLLTGALTIALGCGAG